MTSSSARALALAACLFVPATSLAANPTAQDLATARALYKEGKDLRAAGDLKGALEKLTAAHALGRTPITGIELARTQSQLGLLVEARETCLGVARMSVESDETQRSTDARDEAAKLAEELRPRIASLRIRVTSRDPAVVTVDGEIVPPMSLDQPRKVNPGHHVVTAHVEGGQTVTGSADVAEAQSGEVELSPPPAPEVKAPPDGHDGHAHDAAPQSHGVGGLTIAGIAVTAGGLVLGAAGGIVAMSKSFDLSKACPQNQCPQSQWSSLDDARNAALASTIGFSVAGAGIILLVVGLVTHTSSKESLQGIRVMPDLGLNQIGVRGAF